MTMINGIGKSSGFNPGDCLNEADVLLFDLDGTLVRSPLVEVIIQTANQFGVAVSRQAVQQLKFSGRLTCGWRATHEIVSAARPDISFARVKRCFETLYQGSHRRPGLHALEQLEPELERMHRLSQLFRTGVVTGRPTADALRFLHRFEVHSLMRVVVCREDYAPVLKPHPRPLRIALQKLRVRASDRVWYFGDTPEDMQCAVTAGVRGAGVIAHGDDPALAERALLAAGARFVLSSLDEL
ncbi:MAG: HAD hydrolase-like protein [Bdellovibrionales bacterium]|nr:HAD hydrolase-like protein [Bdellovibrionales bacterium]